LKLLGDSFPADSAAREQLERVRRGVGEIGYAIHRVATALRPTALDDLGLHMTLRNHVADWSRHTGVRAEFRAIGPTDQRLAAGVETALYRIVQEALTNTAKHANATRLSVILERKDYSVRLIIEDNGRGFDADALDDDSSGKEPLGILGMKERVAMTGGSLT